VWSCMFLLCVSLRPSLVNPDSQRYVVLSSRAMRNLWYRTEISLSSNKLSRWINACGRESRNLKVISIDDYFVASCPTESFT
jgi:hypothetical protein